MLSAADPASKTISVAFPEGYVMRDGYTYSLEYRIKPSAVVCDRIVIGAIGGRPWGAGHGLHIRVIA